MVFVQEARKLETYLVRLKFIVKKDQLDHLNAMISVIKGVHIIERKTSFSTVIKKESKINHEFNRNDKCMIYLI